MGIVFQILLSQKFSYGLRHIFGSNLRDTLENKTNKNAANINSKSFKNAYHRYIIRLNLTLT